MGSINLTDYVIEETTNDDGDPIVVVRDKDTGEVFRVLEQTERVTSGLRGALGEDTRAGGFHQRGAGTLVSIPAASASTSVVNNGVVKDPNPNFNDESEAIVNLGGLTGREGEFRFLIDGGNFENAYTSIMADVFGVSNSDFDGYIKHAYGAVGNYLVMAGGTLVTTSGTTDQDGVYVYDTAQDLNGSWNEVAQLPEPLIEYPVSASYNGYLYVFAGLTPTGANTTLYRIDPAVGDVTAVKDFQGELGTDPFPIYEVGSAAVNEDDGEIYFGGQGADSQALYRMDLDALEMERVSTVTGLESAFDTHGFFAGSFNYLNGYVLYVAGDFDTGSNDEAEIWQDIAYYSPEQDTWAYRTEPNHDAQAGSQFGFEWRGRNQGTVIKDEYVIMWGTGKENGNIWVYTPEENLDEFDPFN